MTMLKGNNARRRGVIDRGACLALAVLAMMPALAGAQVRWEDYRGAGGYSGVPYIGDPNKPTFQPSNSVASTTLPAIAANPSNAVRTGTSANIDFGSTDDDGLCNAGQAPNSVACQYQAMGKVMYALIKFPVAGSYNVAAAHDDNVEVQFSSDYTNANYHSANYDIAVGAIANWTNSVNDFESVGNFRAAQANSCALIRVYWSNQGNFTFNRLRWTTPGNVTEIIPASSFLDPVGGASSTDCSGPIEGNAVFTLNKVVGSTRVNAADQFRVSIGTSSGGTEVGSATTTGSGTGQQASTGTKAVDIGGTVYLGDAMASGSASSLSSYVSTIACTRNGTAFTPSGAAPVWSVVPQPNDKIVCTITNTAAGAQPTVTLRKISVGGIGAFSFSGNNGIGSETLTTTQTGSPMAGSTHTLTNASTATTVTESASATGFKLTKVECTGVGAGGTATADLDNSTVTLDAAATALGNAIICTFTNTAQADLQLTKAVTPVKAAIGQAVTYTLTATNNGPGAASGAMITDPMVSGLDCASATPACSSTGGATCPSPLTIAGLQGSGAVVPVFPAGGQVIISLQCTVTGTP